MYWRWFHSETPFYMRAPGSSRTNYWSCDQLPPPCITYIHTWWNQLSTIQTLIPHSRYYIIGSVIIQSAIGTIEQLQLRHESTWQSTSVWQKKYCAQWQLKGSRCLTHDLCAIFIGFTQRDNCTIAIVNIIKTALVSEFIVQPTTLATQTRKITEITKNKQRDVQLIYGRDVTCNCSYTLSMMRGASLAKSITVRSTEVAAPLCPNYCTKSWDLLCRYWCTHKAEWRLPDCDP